MANINFETYFSESENKYYDSKYSRKYTRKIN